jgi:Fe-S cluster biogenesis protein NfuA
MSGDRMGRTVELLGRTLRAHGGGAELVSVREPSDDAQGAVRLRLTGMCRGCPYWPVTLQATIEPLFRREFGDVRVDIEGKAISEETRKRMLALSVVPHLPPVGRLDDVEPNAGCDEH